MTKVEALADLMTSSTESLYEWVYYSHKDFYGRKGHHAHKWSKEELVGWILGHFSFNEDRQVWEATVDFI